MSITPNWRFVSPGQLLDADASDSVHVIVSSGAPEGNADPQASAGQGSLYLRDDQTDDLSSLYVKVDDSDSTDDWALVMLDLSDDDYTRAGDDTHSTDASIYLRDTGQRIYSPAADTGALALAASGDVWKIGDTTGSNYLKIDFRGEMSLTGTARVNNRGAFEIFDDFVYQAIAETDTPWILNKGADPQALDPVISIQEAGVICCTTGDANGTTANDASQIVCAIPVQADSGGLVFEARLHINTAITTVSVCVGLTDVTTLEEPFTNAVDVITSIATDAACFLYDTDATTDTWWMCAVDSDSDDTGNASSGTAPSADTYQVLRIEVSSTGNSVAFYIDGVLKGTLTNAGVSPDVNLYATIIACATTTASKTVDVDYIYVGHTR